MRGYKCGLRMLFDCCSGRSRPCDNGYITLKGWSTEFDLASTERKKMIIGRLIDRIEIGKGYDITIKMNMNYEQFVG